MNNDFFSIINSITITNMTTGLISLCHRLVAAVLIYAVGSFLIKRLIKLIRKIMQKKQIEPSLYSFADSLITIGLYFVLAIAVISTLGIETSSLVALIASAGVAIGMALSGTLQNFAGGVMILIFRPYRVGDYIIAQGYEGTVQQIQIFNTILATPDNQVIIIPNGGLSTGAMKNVSKETIRRVDLNVEVAYGTDPDKLRDVLNKLIADDQRVLKDDAHLPAIPMTKMDSSSIVFQMRMWVNTSDYWGVLFDMTEKTYKSLQAAGIEIPFQQLDVHVKPE